MPERSADIADADGFYVDPWAALYNAHEADDFEGQMVPAIRALMAQVRNETLEAAATRLDEVARTPRMWMAYPQASRIVRDQRTSPGEGA